MSIIETEFAIEFGDEAIQTRHADVGPASFPGADSRIMAEIGSKQDSASEHARPDGTRQLIYSGNAHDRFKPLRP